MTHLYHIILIDCCLRAICNCGSKIHNCSVLSRVSARIQP